MKESVSNVTRHTSKTSNLDLYLLTVLMTWWTSYLTSMCRISWRFQTFLSVMIKLFLVIILHASALQLAGATTSIFRIMESLSGHKQDFYDQHMRMVRWFSMPAYILLLTWYLNLNFNPTKSYVNFNIQGSLDHVFRPSPGNLCLLRGWCLPTFITMFRPHTFVTQWW